MQIVKYIMCLNISLHNQAVSSNYNLNVNLVLQVIECISLQDCQPIQFEYIVTQLHSKISILL